MSDVTSPIRRQHVKLKVGDVIVNGYGEHKTVKTVFEYPDNAFPVETEDGEFYSLEGFWSRLMDFTRQNIVFVNGHVIAD